LAQADAAGEWAEVARSVTRGLEQFLDILGQHRELPPRDKATLLRWLQARYLRSVTALDPSVEQSLREFLTARRRTMDHVLAAACSLQIKLHVRTWCEQALRDPDTVVAGGPTDVGHVGRLLDEVADQLRAALERWDREGVALDALPAEEFAVLGQDFSTAE